MRFHLIVLKHCTIREVWKVDAENRDQAIALYDDDRAEYLEEETIDVTDSWVEEVVNLSDPEGLLEVDEGL